MKTNEIKSYKCDLLSETELKMHSGGLGILAAIAVGLAVAAGAEIFGDWENFKRGLKGLPESKN